LAKKNARVCTRASLPSKLLSLDSLKPFALEKGEWYERILAHRIDCQRAISPPVQQKGNKQLKEYTGGATGSQPRFLRFPQLTVGARGPTPIFDARTLYGMQDLLGRAQNLFMGLR
jgi:hypothetical protein